MDSWTLFACFITHALAAAIGGWCAVVIRAERDYELGRRDGYEAAVQARYPELLPDETPDSVIYFTPQSHLEVSRSNGNGRGGAT